MFLGIQYRPVDETTGNNFEPINSRRRRSILLSGKIDVDKVDHQYCVVIKPAPLTPAPTLGPGTFVEVLPTITNDSLSYNISITNAKCLFWNETLKIWTSDGCVVSKYCTLHFNTIHECLFK